MSFIQFYVRVRCDGGQGVVYLLGVSARQKCPSAKEISNKQHIESSFAYTVHARIRDTHES